MFNYIYHVIWLYGWLEWVEVWLELVICEFLDVDVELCGVLLSKVEIMRFQILPKPISVKLQSQIR